MQYHIDETSLPYLDADEWRPGRKSHCGRSVDQDRLLSYEDFRRRVQAEGVGRTCAASVGRNPCPSCESLHA